MASLILVGASVRAAAWSAWRAGFHELYAADLFADVDLRRIARAVRVDMDRYPHGLVAAAASFPNGPLLYTGGLENHPRVVAALAARRTLWGVDPAALRRARDPYLVASLLAETGLAHPRVMREAPADGRWLVKPRRGAGGAGVRFFRSGEATPRGCFLQEFIEGESYGAVYCGDAAGATLLGLTRQLVGEAWVHATGFRYCGSIGPIPLDETATNDLRRLGDLLARSLGLRGLFGVDLILHAGRFYPVEINPRYTASIEVLERATGLRSVKIHATAFSASNVRVVRSRRERTPQATDVAAKPEPVDSRYESTTRTAGKVILFARDDLLFPADDPWHESMSGHWNNFTPSLADIPQPNSLIRRGEPIMTLFAEAPTPQAVLESLQEKVGDIETRLYR
ncbi:MAG: ATP-grasp domain-containing protein [Gemmataceae bacterium]